MRILSHFTLIENGNCLDVFAKKRSGWIHSNSPTEVYAR